MSELSEAVQNASDLIHWQDAEVARLRAEVERLKHCVATMTPTEAYTVVYDAFQKAEAVMRAAEDFLADNQTAIEAYGWGVERLRMALAAARERA